MSFAASHFLMCSYAVLAIKYATLDTVRRFRALFAAISTSYLSVVAFFNGQQINQSILIKADWKILEIATFRYTAKDSAGWTRYFFPLVIL